MINSDLIARTSSVDLSSGEEFSDHKLSMGADDERSILMRAFLSIKNPATRGLILVDRI
jgi:hypothetical protein